MLLEYLLGLLAFILDPITSSLNNPLVLQLFLGADSLEGYSPIHYPPAPTNTNNLTHVLHGDGPPGIFNSSETPDAVYSATYNWCSMPHVRAKEYPVPSPDYELAYVEVIHRHHKRTPYASNVFFKEDIRWDCDDAKPMAYAKVFSTDRVPIASIAWQATRNSNPMAARFGPGFLDSKCQFPQLTAGGLDDSHQHGLDLASVYRDLLGFLPSVANSEKIEFRVTNNVLTSQVLGAVITGLFSETAHLEYSHALIEPSTFDSLEPRYSCSAADTIKGDYVSAKNPAWHKHLLQSHGLMKQLDAVSGVASDDRAGWHTSYDHYYDNLSAKLCHKKPLPRSTNTSTLCITQDQADKVFRLGNYEYSLIWRDLPQSTKYSGLHFGVWVTQLRSHLQEAITGQGSVRYRHNIAHDGSVASLLSILQIAHMVWPGMGSEVVFELWKRSSDRYYIRVLWGGQPMVTSTPLGALDMIPAERFFDFLNTQLPSDLQTACNV